ncbi:MAG: VCBS repeat-containing protein [Oligoflexia bacterium]|nr:VCBS repeat-containing protein [Oligoflexia bacterium]
MRSRPPSAQSALLLALLLTAGACSDYGLGGKAAETDGLTCVLDHPAGGDIAEDLSCTLSRAPGTFEPEVEWRWDASTLVPGYDDPMMMPAVGDVDGDGMPEVVITTYTENNYTGAGALIILSGQDGTEEGGWTSFGGYQPFGSAGIALGDLDGDGTPEIVTISTDLRVLALHADGSLVWASDTLSGDLVGYTHPAIADLDGDGLAEVVAGAAILDSNGAVVGEGDLGWGGEYAFSVVADLDVDGEQEVITGNAVYRRDGSSVWERPDVEDGWPAVGDFDDDGQGEVVSVRGGSATVTLLDTDGTTIWGPISIPGGGGGPPTVADFDGDGQPEIGVAGAAYYSVFDTDGSVLWSMPTQDLSSARTGSSVFDFEGDGRSEVVYADELTLWIFDGSTGEVRLAWDEHSSWTLMEYPVIVDVDADGQSEIVFMSNDGINPGWQGITVVGDIAESWAPTAPTWNEHGYNITNVEDDLSIPAHPTMNWLTGHNSFRAGGLRDAPGIPAPDLVPVIADVCWQCEDGAARSVDVVLQIDNQGTADVDSTVVAAVWAVSADGDETLIEAITLPLGLAAGTRSEAVQISGSLLGSDGAPLDVTELVARVDTSSAWDAVGLSGGVEECAEGNNAVVASGSTCE